MKILVVGPSWVGDMVMAQSLFMALHERHEDPVIDVLAPDWTRPLLDRMPEVAQAITMPVGHGAFGWKQRRQLGRALKQEHYDQAIVLPNSLKSALIPWFAGIPLRTGWRGEMRYGLLNDCRRLDRDRLPLMVQRFVALASPGHDESVPEYRSPSLLVSAGQARSLLERFGLDPAKPALVLCPGAEFGPSKQWPASGYREVALDAVNQGRQVWIAGSEKDRAVGAVIADGAGGSILNLAGQTTLAEVIDLMSLAEAVVTNDSGLMHVAAALDRPLVAIYGSTSPAFTPPLASSVSILTPSLDCSPCFERECPLQHHDCMKQTRPATIIESLRALEKNNSGEAGAPVSPETDDQG